jgi:transcription antitermination protein NusB
MSFDKEEKGSGTRRKARVCALQMLFGYDLVQAKPFDPLTFWSELGYEEARPGTVAQVAAYRDEVSGLAARLSDFRASTRKFDSLGRGVDHADALKGIQQSLTRHEDRYLQSVKGLTATGRLEVQDLVAQLSLARTSLETLRDRIIRSTEASRDRRDKDVLSRYLEEANHALAEVTKLNSDLLPKVQKAAESVFPIRDFATRIAAGTVNNLSVVDDRIRSRAEHWRIERMALVDRNILRLAVYEFLFEDTPKTVVINEALEIARRFSTFEATQFINGILDAIKLDLEKAAKTEEPKADGKATSS